MGINQPAAQLSASSTAGTAVLLPVAQFKDSHDLVIDLKQIGPGGTKVVAPPYQAMSVGDKVPLKVERFWSDGWEDDPEIRPKILTEADIGRPLQWDLSVDPLYGLEGGYVKLSYRIVYATVTETTDSQTQRLDVVETTEASSALLPPPAVKDYDSDMLDPEAFRGGVPLVIPLYPGIQVGDDVVLYAVVTDPLKNLNITARVDQSTIDSAILRITLDYEWLSNVGNQVSLMYQYARIGEAGTSSALLLKLRKPLNLPTPIINDAVAEDEDKGYLLGERLTSGIYINIPPEAEYDLTYKAQVFFDGYGSTGQWTADPTFGDSQRFQIPHHVVPANLGKRLFVYYRVTPPGESPYPSVRYDLGIKDVARGWPTIQIISPPGASNTSVSLKTVTTEVGLRLPAWMFMYEGQRIRIPAEGFLPSGKVEKINLRVGDAEWVTEDEDDIGEVKVMLPVAFLQKLKLNEKFDVIVQASFDERLSYKNFPRISPQLIA